MIPYLPIPPIKNVTHMTAGVFYTFPCGCNLRHRWNDDTPMFCRTHLPLLDRRS